MKWKKKIAELKYQLPLMRMEILIMVYQLVYSDGVHCTMHQPMGCITTKPYSGNIQINRRERMGP